MKDEIKEILQLIGTRYYYGEISEDKYEKYCNYLINSQEEYEKLNNLFEYNMQTLVNTDKLYENYKSRCEKARDKIQYIIGYGFDYDGFNTVESLKGLIDMLVDYARQSKDILNGGDDNE